MALTLATFGLYHLDQSRVPHISLVFREMWDTTGLPLKPAAGPTNPLGQNCGCFSFC